MDRLKEVALAGDLDEFYKCIQGENVQRYIDEEVGHLFYETPLHITAARGHINFAMTLIYLKPSWGRKLNQEMHSPMHLAVQQGHNELVCALLTVDRDLVRVKGKNGYTALHYAAENGNLELLVYFVKDCPQCLDDMTNWNQTALHVATLNGRLEALEILALYIRRTHLYSKVSKLHLLHSKDIGGNTVLHLAASTTQPQMIKLLLECKVNMKVTNKRGSTALDLLEVQSTENPDREICLDTIRNNIGLKFMNLIEMVFYSPYSWNFINEPLHIKLGYKITSYEEFVSHFIGGDVVHMSY